MIGWRKVLVLYGVLALAVSCVVTGGDVPPEMATIMKLTVAGVLGLNGYEHYQKAKQQ